MIVVTATLVEFGNITLLSFVKNPAHSLLGTGTSDVLLQREVRTAEILDITDKISLLARILFDAFQCTVGGEEAVYLSESIVIGCLGKFKRALDDGNIIFGCHGTTVKNLQNDTSLIGGNHLNAIGRNRIDGRNQFCVVLA